MLRLVTVLIVPVILLLFTASSAQPFASTRPQPQSEWQLADAPIGSMVKKRILAELNKEASADEQPSASAHAPVKLVRLDANGRMGIEVRAPNEWCSATGNCEVWIFDSKTGDLLVHGDGWDYGFRRTTHHGVLDFYVRSNMSAGTGTLDEYQFDGKVYQQVDSTGEQY